LPTYLQVKEIRPYYFDLEEVFLEHAGIKSAATTDEVFGGSGDSLDSFDTNDGITQIKVTCQILHL